jgi:hypothetical protein
LEKPVDTYYSDSNAYLAFLLLLIPLFLIGGVILYVVSAFFLMKIFDKAGVEGKWRAWVPVYNTLVLAKLGDVSPWIALAGAAAAAILGQIPVIGWLFGLVGIAISVMYSWRVGLKLGKEWYWLLLWLIPGLGTVIWLGILAFDSSRWNTAIAPAPWANTFLADKTVWQGVPTQGTAGGVTGAGYAAPGYPATGAYPPPPAGYTPPAAGAPTPPPAAPGQPPVPPTEPPAPPAAPEPPRP